MTKSDKSKKIENFQGLHFMDTISDFITTSGVYLNRTRRKFVEILTEIFAVHNHLTVLPEWNLTRASVWSKMAVFKRAWQKKNVLPHLSSLGSKWALMRAFKRGTVWPCTLRGTGNTTGQSWRFHFCSFGDKRAKVW